jgi:hypothetical protein
MIYMVIGSLDGLPSYLLEDKAYPFLPWLMTLHKRDNEHHSVMKFMYN